MSNLIPLSLIIGGIAGLNSASWGGYKDSPFESFYFLRYVRSIIAGAIIGILIFNLFQFLSVDSFNLGVFFAMVIAFERIYTEVGKMISTKHDPKLFKIPQNFHIQRETIKNKAIVLLIGALAIFFLIITFSVLHIIPYQTSFSHFYFSLTVGFVGGLFIGISGGLIKDVPYEKFNLGKFLRSPLIGLIWGAIFSFLTNNYGQIFIASLGMERMTIEFYKTFIRNKSPGKFRANKPKYTQWIKKRKIFILPYIFTWVVFFFLLIR